MARSSWRQRSDGVYQIVAMGRRAQRIQVALLTLLVAFAMFLAVVGATLVYLVIGLPFLALAATFLLVRRARRRAGRSDAPSAAVLTLGRHRPRAKVAARDAGA